MNRIQGSPQKALWRAWALVWIYFTTFGGFIALTAWLPIYWTSFFGVSAVKAGFLTAAFSILASLVRILGGTLSDHLKEGGEHTAILWRFQGWCIAPPGSTPCGVGLLVSWFTVGCPWYPGDPQTYGY